MIISSSNVLNYQTLQQTPLIFNENTWTVFAYFKAFYFPRISILFTVAKQPQTLTI